MTPVLARMIMTLATCCLGEARRDWALAMQGEFEAAREAGKPLAFATGCLIAACREMPRHQEGRFALANHGLALGVLLPIAGLQLLCAAGLAFPQGTALHGAPAPGSAQEFWLADAYLAAVPLLLGLWSLLCVLHLRLAWLLLERDWQGVIRVGSLIAAGTLTLLLFSGVLLVDDRRTVLQAGIVTIELMAIAASAQWHARLPSGSALEKPAGN